ncbi:MAG: hypothetical protein ACREX3_11740 [Gammaproteobacteria bacterium]
MSDLLAIGSWDPTGGVRHSTLLPRSPARTLRESQGDEVSEFREEEVIAAVC